MSNTGLILLAAGNSSRMGTIKQLLPFRGQPMIRHAAQTALDAGCDPVIVVLGSHEEAIRPALEGLEVEIAVNDEWSQGMGSSIQTGLRQLANRSVTGAILALADQPLVTSKYLRRLVEKHENTGRPIVASSYSGTVGVPVYFHREAFALLMALKAAEGCKGVILGNQDQSWLVACQEAAIDIDTPADYKTALAGMGSEADC